MFDAAGLFPCFLVAENIRVLFVSSRHVLDEMVSFALLFCETIWMRFASLRSPKQPPLAGLDVPGSPLLQAGGMSGIVLAWDASSEVGGMISVGILCIAWNLQTNIARRNNAFFPGSGQNQDWFYRL